MPPLSFTLRRSRRSPSGAVRFFSAALTVAIAFAPFRHIQAGDILRGGSAAGPSREPGVAGANSGTLNEVGAIGRDTLARTTQALQAVKAMQDAARRAAINGPNNLGIDPNHAGIQLPNVPNGLTSGGLQVAPKVPANLSAPVAGEDPSLWQGASLPTQTAANGRTNVNIIQNTQQALLNWKTFNVGKETKLTFDQTAGGENASQWIAFNKINDPSGVPSQILGSIDAVGQIYLINQNGIIFGGSSQINLHTLVASSLPINDNLVARGLLNNPDLQFLFSSLAIPILPNGGTMPAFSPPAPPNTPGGKIGAVTVQAGALLTSPTTPDHVGGRVALIGPDVTNGGTISTADGQTILAAGQQVALTAHPSSDPSLRGLDVFIGKVDADRGIASNSGLIDAPRANVTMAGQQVDQLGVIDSSTSVSLNGRIDLLANFNALQIIDAGRNVTLNPTASGLVSLGANSITQIVPELTSSERVVGTQLALPSLVRAQGKAIHFANNAVLLAPGATTPAASQPALAVGGLALTAGVTLAAGDWLAATVGHKFVFDRGQVYLDPGALIDVSGSAGVQASVAENFVQAQLRGAELANSPLQRNGPLRGQTITIDIRDMGVYNGQTWIGTPLADVSGYVNLVQRTVGELTTSGGTVKINAGDSVVVQPGASIDVSGGSIDYQGAFVERTKVISGGNIFDVSQATPDRIYTGIYNGSTTFHPKFGITETNSSGIINGAQFEPGYTQGANGGTLSITAPSMALDGALLGNTVSGARQRSTPPIGSTLALAFQKQASIDPFLPFSPTPPRVTFRPGAEVPPVGPFALDPSGNPLPLRADRIAGVILSPDILSAGGFGNLKIDNSDGDIVVTEDASLTSAPGGSIIFSGANITLRGQVTAPGGNLSFTALDVSPSALVDINATQTTPPPDFTRGNLFLGSSAVLNAAGLITDQRQPSDAFQLRPFAGNGGSITLAGFNVNLAPGSLLDVSGGVTVSAVGAATYGTGGALTINGGQDPSLPSLLGGNLSLGGELRGYSGARGGSLSLRAPLIRVGAAPDVTPFAMTLQLQPRFFSSGGFNSYALSGSGSGIGSASATLGEYVPAIVIGANTVITPAVESLLVNLDQPGSVTLDRTTLPVGVRSPVNLSFNATGAQALNPTPGAPLARGDFLMSESASIFTDPGASVSLRGDTAAVLGSVVAPGGSITISGAGNSTGNFSDGARPLPTVDLGPRSFFSVAGTTVLTPNSLGFRTGRVLAGGSISVTGNIVAERGSVLDVSGASDVLDLARGFSSTSSVITPGDALLVPTRVESNAGTITLNGRQELFLDATLIGRPGGASANGGSVFITTDRFVPRGGTAEPLSPLTIAMFVTQSGPTIPQLFYGANENAIGRFVTGTSATGGAHIAADTFTGNGIESLSLRGVSGIGGTQVDGPVSLTLGRQISITGGALLAESDVKLSAPYLKFGTDFQTPVPFDQIKSAFGDTGQPIYISPQFGSGTLTAAGHLIDIGNLSLQKIGASTFIADNGDIRGGGTLNAAGAITLTAGQIYPVTEVRFTIAADDYLASGFTLPGVITINQSGTRQTPLSAGGELDVFASIIRQAGTLRAPIGTINLGNIGTTGSNLISNQPFAVTRQLTLDSGSVTSVSADGLTIPYGINQNGTAWIDPAGVDITVGGVPGKAINIAAANVADVAGSTIDIRGGGDLFSYRFVSGNGGTRDILSNNSSFAIVPGYAADFAPIDPGYANSTLAVGDRIFLNASAALPAGFYTLLPARYALMPGAVLITQKSGVPTTVSALLAEGSSVVSGYRFNDLNPARAGQSLNSLFEVAPAAVLRGRAQYDIVSANTFLRDSALAHDAIPPRLPIDSGQLVLSASQTMAIQGAVVSQAPTGGRGGLVDISSPVDILIGRAGGTAPEGTLFLDAAALSSFGAESLLIGGVRSVVAGIADPGGARRGNALDQPGSATPATTIAVTTGNLTVDNSGSSLTSPELILVAKKNLTLAAGAELEQKGALAGSAETLLFGSDAVAGSGDGLLVRLTSDAAAQILRMGVDSSTVPTMTIGAGARITGTSLTLDSTYATHFDPTATLSATAIALNSGQISLQLSGSAGVRPTAGLILSDATLQSLQAGLQSFSLLSYSSIDIYGSGQIGSAGVGTLALHTGEIRGFDNQGGTVVFEAKNILLDNTPDRSAAAAFGGGLGTLQFNAETIRLGKNQLKVDQFSNVVLNASGAILAQNAGGLATAGNLTLRTPLLTGAAAADQTLSAIGALTIETPDTTTASSITGGLGARLTLVGSRIVEDSNIVLPSGSLTMRATFGDVSLGGKIDVAGTAQSFFDLVKYTSGGEVNLSSDQGNVTLLPGSSIDVSAQSGGGDAGRLSITTAGVFTFAGALKGTGGAPGKNGSFSLDVGQLGTLAALDEKLNASSFNEARTIRVRTGDVLVDGLATVHRFNLSADAGSIQVTGDIDASGVEGGAIALRAAGSVILASGSQLSVAAQNFDAAGKGGAISLEAGAETNGVVSNTAFLNLESGSTIDLSVAANTSASLGRGQLTGTLHLRAPQTAGNSDLQIATINSTILGASSIVVEGYQLFDLTGTNGSLTSAVQEAVRSNGQTFGAGEEAMRARLLANNFGLSALTVVEPGAEIINRSGDLTLGSPSSDSSSDWDLSSYRVGPNNAPGNLTLRAAGSIVFYNALSDGFKSGAYNATLLAHNSALPANAQSWSYRIASGADFSAADFHRVQAIGLLAPDSGSVRLGKDYGNNVFTPSQGGVPSTAAAVRDRYQVIRTGTGDIDIASGRDVQLLNQFATIFTAGTRVDDPTLGGTFDVPIPDATGQQPSILGPIQQDRPGYAPQYSYAGGNISITAQNDVTHLTRANDGTLIADSSRELPNNWLYRRGFVDPTTGAFGAVTRPNRNDIGSTTWWVDFSNFFEGIGTLGGGNIELAAGHNVSNIDAVAPTNARMPKGVPNESKLLELGGGNVTVRAGNDLDAGVYYVERGLGTLTAGGSIHTNSTRSPSLGTIATPAEIFAPETWLPTTLFVGKGIFDVSALGDLELGPTANPFLLPQGVNNTFWYKTYFSTYAPTSAVQVSSLTGNLTLRESGTPNAADAGLAVPLLQAWFNQVLRFDRQVGTASSSQPWLRLAESQVGPFETLASVSAPSLLATAFAGDLNLVGNISLFPSPVGTVDLAARKAINGVQRNGSATISRAPFATFGASRINLSDADPARIPSVTTPFAFRSTLVNPAIAIQNQIVDANFFAPINLSFNETGSTVGTAGVLQTKQALHAAGLLHLNDPIPVHVYATAGDVSGLTLFAGKPLKLVSGRDVTDIALYVQNNHSDDITLVAAGRDLIAYDPNSPLRVLARTPGNLLNKNAQPASGDIQINGPGTLETLAGRNFDLGVGPGKVERIALGFPDDIGLGIRSVGNSRNPYLPFGGADIVGGAGIGMSSGLDASQVRFRDFEAKFLDPVTGGATSARYLPKLGKLLGLTSESAAQVWQAFQQLPAEQQDNLALQIFYLVLRDAGRDRNDPDSSGFGNYDQANEAIAALFPGDNWRGDISLTSREIKTANGGNISLFAPGGQLVVGFDISGTQAVDQGILTEHGGDISIYTQKSVVVGTSRIFTLRGGNEVIFSRAGDIAAGASSKTVQSAPPTRVLIDPQSGDVKTDLAGLATGGGIGVLNTVAGLPPSDIDLIAPTGTVDAGDAGIRVSGNLNIAAVQVLNAGNISTGGASIGTPTVAAPNLGGLTAASNAAGAQTTAANDSGPRTNNEQQALPSIITVEVLGYGGGDGDPDNTDDEEEKKRRKKEQEQTPQGSRRAPQQVIASAL